MERENIMALADSYMNRYAEDYPFTKDTIFAAFVEGASRANYEHAKVWHKASDEPEIGSNIVVIDYDGQWLDIQPYDGDYNGYGDLTGWACCAIHYNIKQWAYINELIED